jgi:capsule polysaccharide export protein KpsC/LpsZ
MIYYYLQAAIERTIPLRLLEDGFIQSRPKIP